MDVFLRTLFFEGSWTFFIFLCRLLESRQASKVVHCKTFLVPISFLLSPFYPTTKPTTPIPLLLHYSTQPALPPCHLLVRVSPPWVLAVVLFALFSVSIAFDPFKAISFRHFFGCGLFCQPCDVTFWVPFPSHTCLLANVKDQSNGNVYWKEYFLQTVQKLVSPLRQCVSRPRSHELQIFLS